MCLASLQGLLTFADTAAAAAPAAASAAAAPQDNGWLQPLVSSLETVLKTIQVSIEALAGPFEVTLRGMNTLTYMPFLSLVPVNLSIPPPTDAPGQLPRPPLLRLVHRRPYCRCQTPHPPPHQEAGGKPASHAVFEAQN